MEGSAPLEYVVAEAGSPPEGRGLWDGDAWRGVSVLDVACFRPESSAHRPQTRCKLLYSPERLYGIFRVEDRYVRCIHQGFQTEVYRDSCVEFFVQPVAGGGYFNFEFNGGGAMLASYVTDPTRVAGQIKARTPLSLAEGLQIVIYHSLPAVVEPEVAEPVVWVLEFSMPFGLLETYAGPFGKVKGQIWRANFYKCGNETSHPHWASWAPIGALNFHLPEYFGDLQFASESFS